MDQAAIVAAEVQQVVAPPPVHPPSLTQVGPAVRVQMPSGWGTGAYWRRTMQDGSVRVTTRESTPLCPDDRVTRGAHGELIQTWGCGNGYGGRLVQEASGHCHFSQAATGDASVSVGTGCLDGVRLM